MRAVLSVVAALSCLSFAWAETPAGVPFDPATDTLVPGDELTKTCTFTVIADGTHLRADLAASGGTASGALAPALSVAGDFTLEGGLGGIRDPFAIQRVNISREFDPPLFNATLTGAMYEFRRWKAAHVRGGQWRRPSIQDQRVR